MNEIQKLVKRIIRNQEIIQPTHFAKTIQEKIINKQKRNVKQESKFWKITKRAKQENQSKKINKKS